MKWSVPGAVGSGTDHSAGRVFAITDLTASGDQSRTVQLDAAVVQNWIDHLNANQGLLLINEGAGTVEASGNNAATVAQRPKLSIQWQ